MDRSLVCLISGKKYIFNSDYHSKKIEEYGDPDSLKKFFVTKKVKSLLEREYSVDEIRRMLEVDEENLPSSNSETIKEIVNFHKMRFNSISRKVDTISFSNKTDPEVAAFINNIKNNHEEKIYTSNRR